MAENQKIRQLKLQLEQDSDIKLAILFGSCANETAGPESDVDLAILLSAPLLNNKKIQIIQRVAQIFGRAVDLVDLQKAGEPILSQIIKYGIVIKGNQQDYVALTIKNVYANEDFLPYIKRSLQARREKWI